MQRNKFLKIAKFAYLFLSITVMVPLVYLNLEDVLIGVNKYKSFVNAHEALEKAKLSLKENREKTYFEARKRIQENSANQGISSYRPTTSPVDDLCFDSFGKRSPCENVAIGKMKVRSISSYGIHNFEPVDITSAIVFSTLNILFGFIILYGLKKWAIWMMTDSD